MSLIAVLAITLGLAPIHPFDNPQPTTFPSEVAVIIEVQAGSNAKYEIDRETGTLFLDRYLSTPMVYPSHYGSICQTLMPDGDPLDVLLFSRHSIQPGALVRVRPIGVMKMIDGDEVDDKVIAVPTKRVDPTMESIQKLEHLPELDLDRLKLFFETYKQLPKGGKTVKVPGYLPQEDALKLLRSAHEQYSKEILAKKPKEI